MGDIEFPYSELSDKFAKEPVDIWFKKCMVDFPTSVDGITMINGHPCQATLEVPQEVTRWFNKWFGQFVEGA